MSAGTSGILPSATYAACDGANSTVGKDPLWLSTAGGSVVGNVGVTGNLAVSGTSVLTGAVSMPAGIVSYPFTPANPAASGTAGVIRIGNIGWCWQVVPIDASHSATMSIVGGFLNLLTASAILPNAINLLVQLQTSAPAGTIRFDTVTPAGVPAGAGSPVTLFAMVEFAPPA
jgi:hypothetical protein